MIRAGLLVALMAGTAAAGPLATAREDVDGDGVADAIELGSDGVLHVGGKRKGDVAVATGATQARIAIARAGGEVTIVVDVTTAGGREAVIVDGRAGWKIATRFPLGGVGLDHEYGVEVTAGPDGVVRYQTRWGAERCDGKPPLLFAERLEGGTFKRLEKLASYVPAGAPAVSAKLDAAPPAAPLLYQAKAASHQVGATDAGALAIPRELDDGRADTGWREDFASSAGEGQWFTFRPRVPSARAQQLRIVPGNPASVGAMRSYNRPRALAIVAAHGAWRVELPDAANDPLGAAYVIELPQPIEGCVTVVLESTYGKPQGTTAIAELELFAEGERTGGGEAMLARLVAEDKDGSIDAAAALARRGAAATAAIDAELARTTDAGARRRLIAALVKVKDPSAAPLLVRAASAGWVHDQDLIDVIGALGASGQAQPLHDLAANDKLPLPVRIAAVMQLPVKEPLLLELAGHGPRELRHEVIERLAAAPLMALLQAASNREQASASGDLWRAITRHARSVPGDRAAAVAAMLVALPGATDYERRYRLVDGIATHGDAAALTQLAAALRALPAGAQASVLRQVAIRGIASTALRGEGIDLVIAFARDTDPGTRLAAIAALSHAESDAAGPWHGSEGPDAIDRVIITALGSDTWPEIRRRAASALGARCQRAGPGRALTDSVGSDPDLEVRGDALTALVQCHAGNIRELLARTWNNAKLPLPLRQRAVSLVVMLGDRQLATALVGKFTQWRGEAISSADALVLAQGAADAIGKLAVPGAAQVLMDALDDSAFPEIVAAAALGLGALGKACPPAAKAKLTTLARSEEQSAQAARHAALQCGR